MLNFSYELIARWLPYPADPLTVEDYLGNKNLYPQTLPTTGKTLFLDLAILREKLRSEKKLARVEASTSRSPTEPVVIPQVIPEEILDLTPNVTWALLVFLDSFEPRGIISLSSPKKPKLAVCLVLETDNLDFKKLPPNLGEAEIDFGLSEIQKMTLPKDELIKIPTPQDQKMKLEIKTSAGVKILGGEKIKMEVSTGSLGLIIDTRGRPMNLPEPDASGRTRLLKWQKGLGLP